MGECSEVALVDLFLSRFTSTLNVTSARSHMETFLLRYLKDPFISDDCARKYLVAFLSDDIYFPNYLDRSINDFFSDEVLCLIFSFAQYRDRASILKTCKRWYTCARSGFLPTMDDVETILSVPCVDMWRALEIDYRINCILNYHTIPAETRILEWYVAQDWIESIPQVLAAVKKKGITHPIPMCFKSILACYHRCPTLERAKVIRSILDGAEIEGVGGVKYLMLLIYERQKTDAKFHLLFEMCLKHCNVTRAIVQDPEWWQKHIFYTLR